MEPTETIDWYSVAVDFQTATVGFIGFVGVIGAQLLNGHLARKRDKESEARRAASIRLAISTELKILGDAIDPDDRPVNEYKDDIYVPVIDPKITRSLLSDIGILGPERAKAVAEAFATIEAHDDSLDLLGQRSGSFTLIEASKAPMVMVMRRNLSTKILTEVEKLEE